LSRAAARICRKQEDNVMIPRILLVAMLALVVAAPAQSASVDKREKRQAHRINKGEKSRLSHKEANRLRSQEAGIKNEESAMREAHGGHLTSADKRALQKDETRTSHHIYHQKHDDNGH
jgi:hypothetical protein